jgi:biopolymer transport protein TolR
MALSSQRRTQTPPDAGAGELNLVPYLDIMMNLIMFMLLSMTALASWGVVNVSAPRYPPDRRAEAVAQPSALDLTVLITERGFFVAASGGVLPNDEAGAPTIKRRADGDFDFSSLTQKLTEVKRAFPQETKVIIGADASIPYATAVRTMDACRENPAVRVDGQPMPLFFDVSIAVQVQ